MSTSSHIIDGEKLSSQVGQGLKLITPDINNSSPLMQGSFLFTKLRDGMVLHCTDIVHLQDMSTQFDINEKCIKILLKLEGNADVKIGKQTLPLDAGEGPRAVPKGVVVSLNEPVTFSRNSLAGTRQRMVVLTLTPFWFEAVGIPESLFRDDLNVFKWAPTARTIAVAEQLIYPISNAGPLQMLHQECLALELVVKALSLTLPEEPSQPAKIPATAYQRILHLQALLDSGKADQLDMRGIAKTMACNPNTLQQQFRAVFGQTIFDYLRKSRLQRAGHALQHDGISVGRAADIAGYSSQANFSTAFHRHFGSLPKHYRNKS